MRKSRVYRTEAVVLRGYDYGEADRILTLYTPAQGKLRATAKGVRRTKSHMGGHLDLFMRSSLLVASGRKLDIVTQAETIENFRPARDDLWRSTLCHYVAELVESFTVEQLANYPMYALTVATLRRIATTDALDITLRAFELQLLSLMGYRPQLHRCLQCNEHIQAQTNYFSSRLGGVLCPTCSSQDRLAPSVSVDVLKVMRNLQTNEESMVRAGGVSASTSRDVEKRLREYIVFRLESKPRSISFLDRLRFETRGTQPPEA